MQQILAISRYTLLEARCTRLPLLLAVALALMLALGFFVSELAVIESARLRLSFYAHVLRVALNVLLCLTAGLTLAALAAATRVSAAGLRLAFWAGMGGAFGSILATAVAWPLRRDEMLWALPTPPSQLALLAACAMLGWSLSLWRAES